MIDVMNESCQYQDLVQLSGPTPQRVSKKVKSAIQARILAALSSIKN